MILSPYKSSYERIDRIIKEGKIERLKDFPKPNKKVKLIIKKLTHPP